MNNQRSSTKAIFLSSFFSSKISGLKKLLKEKWTLQFIAVFDMWFVFVIAERLIYYYTISITGVRKISAFWLSRIGACNTKTGFWVGPKNWSEFLVCVMSDNKEHEQSLKCHNALVWSSFPRIHYSTHLWLTMKNKIIFRCSTWNPQRKLLARREMAAGQKASAFEDKKGSCPHPPCLKTRCTQWGTLSIVIITIR